MLTQMLQQACEQNPDKAAVVQGEKRLSYQQLTQFSACASTGLQELGIAESDCVAVILPNCAEFVITLFACARIGAVMLPLNPRYTHDELSRFLSDAQARVIITDSDHLDICEQISTEAELPVRIVICDYVSDIFSPQSLSFIGRGTLRNHKELNFSALLANPESSAPTGTHCGRALYLYTSGSTSEYKRLCCTQENLYYEAHNFVETIGLGADDNILCTVPLYHSYGLGNGLLDAIYTGSTLILLDNPIENGRAIDPPFVSRIHDVLQLIHQEKVRFLPAVPYQFATLADLPEEVPADLSSISWCISSGDVLPESTYQRFLQRFGLPIRSLYGSTEAGSIAMNTSATKDVTFGSLGRSLENVTIEIRNPAGNVLGQNESGVIWVKSPVIPPTGYDNRPELSEGIFRDGYYDTGDMGLLDDDEQLVITGRKQTFVDVGGYKVDISEVEEVLINNPAVREAAVLGIDAPSTGQLIKAVIVLHDDHLVTIEEIQSWCRDSLVTYKVPRLIEFRGALPRSPLGKVLKKELHTTQQPTNESAPLAEALEAMNANPEQRRVFIAATLQEQIAATLQIDNDKVLPTASFQSMGFDSIRSAELQDRLIRLTGLPLSIMLLWNYPSIAELSQLLLERLSPQQSQGSQANENTEQNPKNNQANGATQLNSREPLAIIGIGCRFPGEVSSPEQFWEFLLQGGNGISEVPAERWDVEHFFDPDPNAPGKSYSRWGGFLSDVSGFDAGFFNVSPREAMQMDPRQRLLLETAWEALEHAACAPESLSGSQTGVFIGHMVGDYHGLMGDNMPLMDSYASTGVLDSLLANRLSYTLNLQGPSVSVDTACSSALSALYLAGQNLRQGDCNLALVGGVNLMLTPEMHVVGAKAGILSPTGSCSTFSDDADGFVRGEGCGVIVLKRLSDAQRDNDNIMAVVHGTAMNQDGQTNGIAAPNGFSQQRVIQQALINANLEAEQVSLIEAHGTGTLVGDPIEVEALSEAYGSDSESTPICHLGAIKTNIGHLEGAAGIAGLIKMSLCLDQQCIPPNINFRQLNPHINLDATRFTLPLEEQAWEILPEQARYGAVSSFGIGGTNGHVILGEAPDTNKVEQYTGAHYYLFPLAARSTPALKTLAQSQADYLKANPEIPLADIAYTLQTGRNHFAECRQSIIADSISDLSAQLKRLATHEPSPTPDGTQTRKTAFMFTGQGSQYPGMGQELYQTESVFRQSIDQCAALLQHELSVPLLEVLYPSTEEAHALINQTAFTQPALFAVEYALAQLWQSWGVRPDWVMGHSVGEYVAACIAGAFSLADGLKLIAARGRLMQALPDNGTMLAVRADEKTVAELVALHADLVSIAAFNGPQSLVLSGEKTAIAAIAEQLQTGGIDTQQLNVSHGFHSPLMKPMLAEFSEVAQQINYTLPTLNVVSNVSGASAQQELTDPAYWVNHVRAAVRFAQGMVTLEQQGCSTLLEIGPHPTLSTMGQQFISPHGIVWASSLDKKQPDSQAMLSNLGHLYQHGLSVDWQGFNQPHPANKLRLPTYPFQRQRYWLFDQLSDSQTRRNTPNHTLRPLVHTMIRSPRLQETLFETLFDLETFPFFKDHQVHEQVVIPGAAYLSTLFSNADVIERPICYLADLLFPAAMVLNPDEVRQVQVIMTPKSGDNTAQGKMAFELLSWPYTDDLSQQPATDTHMIGQFGWGKNLQQNNIPVLAELQSVWTQQLDPEQLYSVSREQHIEFGPAFRWMQQLWKNDDGTETLARLAAPATLNTHGYNFHPALLDSCFQVAASTLLGTNETETWLPFLIRQVYLVQVADCDEYWCHARQTSHHVWDITLFNKDGEVLLFIQGFEERPVPASALAGKTVWEDWLYQVQWQADETVLTEPQPALVENEAIEKRSWLIFADNGGLGNHLANTLGDQGHTVKRVFAGTAYTQIDHNTYCVNAQSTADYQQILLGQPNNFGIIYLWGLDQNSADNSRSLERHQLQNAHQVCTPLLKLIQALGSTDFSDLQGLWLITRNTQQVNTEDTINGLLQAPLWGLHKTLIIEHPELNSRIVDIDSSEDTLQLGQVIRELLPQANSTTKQERQIAYRGEQRYLARLIAQPDTGDYSESQTSLPQPLSLTESGTKNRGTTAIPPHERKPIGEDKKAIDPNASYLITGGLGGLGLTAGEWLISRGTKHLILVGRSAPSATAKQKISQFQQQGTAVSVILTDIGNQQRLQKLLASFETNKPLKGIIHAAGTIDDATLLQQTPQQFENVMAAKVQGTWNLHQLSLDMPLDFFIMFSSMASMLGGVGQANYAAANAFMDQLASYRRQKGLPALSINWGGWSDVGMAARMGDNELRRLHQRGEVLISPEQGKEILSFLLNQHSAQVGVLPVDWSAYLPATRGDSDAFFAQLNQLQSKTQEKPAALRPRKQWRQTLDETPVEQQLSVLESYLRQTLADIMALPDSDLIEARRGLRELGLDSILSIEVRGKLEDDLACSLPATLLFDYPTLETLSSYLAEKVLKLQTSQNSTNGSISPSQSGDLSLADDADLDNLLAEIGQISDADIQQQLTRTTS